MRLPPSEEAENNNEQGAVEPAIQQVVPDGIVSSDMYIEYVDIEEVQVWPGNPKDHDLGKIRESMLEFGYVTPGLIDETTSRIVEGHGRGEVLVQMKNEGKPAPDRVKVTEDGRWLMPFVRGIAFASEEAAAAYVIASNRLTELGGWVEPRLDSMLDAIKERNQILFERTGFDEDDHARLKDILKARNARQPKRDEVIEASSELVDKWGVQFGQLWAIPSEAVEGEEHRLMCGDSTIQEMVAYLMDGNDLRLMITDPPYGVNLRPGWRAEVGLNTSTPRGHELEGDDRADWGEVYPLYNPQILYVWHGGLHAAEVAIGIVGAGYDIRSQIIWNKPNIVVSRGHYHWKHEPCWYAVKKGETGHWEGDRKQRTVWDFASPIAGELTEADQDDRSTSHPTQKPVDVYLIPIQNHTVYGDIVADAFVGSGTVYVAAEELSRIAYGMEFDPYFVATTLERLSRLGLEPYLKE